MMNLPNSEVLIKVNEWVLYFKSKFKLLVVSALFGLLIGLFYSYSKKTIFVASLTYTLEEQNSSINGIGAFTSSFGFDIWNGGNGGVFSESNLIEFFKSRKMIEMTLLTQIKKGNNKVTLADLYIQEDDNNFNKKLLFCSNLTRDKFTRNQDSILGGLYQKILTRNLSIELIDKKRQLVQ